MTRQTRFTCGICGHDGFVERYGFTDGAQEFISVECANCGDRELFEVERTSPGADESEARSMRPARVFEAAEDLRERRLDTSAHRRLHEAMMEDAEYRETYEQTRKMLEGDTIGKRGEKTNWTLDEVARELGFDPGEIFKKQGDE